MHTCIKCEEAKEIKLFPKRKDNERGHGNICKKCKSVYYKKYYENNSDYIKKNRQKYCKENKFNVVSSRYLNRYNISYDDYISMVIEQDNKCKICNLEGIHNTHGKLCVDHCHETLKVRGLLCTKCNFGIGSFNDNTSFLESAIKYLTDNNN